jgi:hypothetical protein
MNNLGGWSLSASLPVAGEAPFLMGHPSRELQVQSTKGQCRRAQMFNDHPSIASSTSHGKMSRPGPQASYAIMHRDLTTCVSIKQC